MVATSSRMPARIGEAMKKPRRSAAERFPLVVARASVRSAEVAVMAVMSVLPQWWLVSTSLPARGLNRIWPRTDLDLVRSTETGSAARLSRAVAGDHDAVLIGVDHRLHPVAEPQLGEHVA